MGDVNALLLGPAALLTRLFTKAIYRTFTSLLRGMGL